MNIHFTDTNLFNDLKANALFSIKMGSHLYGLNTSESDEDILYIVAESESLTNSFLWEHHQLQYKEDKKDHIFTSLKQFIRNLMTGDSTINFEVIHSQEMKNSSLNFLYTNRHFFYNYQIIKSYLGLARRDLKQVQENLSFINYKKLSHAYRGLITTYGITNQNYDNHFTNYQTEFSEFKNLKLNKTHGNVSELISDLSQQVDKLREEINKKFSQQEIKRIMDLSHMTQLDSWLQEFCSRAEYKAKQNYQLDKQIYFEVLEKGLKY